MYHGILSNKLLSIGFRWDTYTYLDFSGFLGFSRRKYYLLYIGKARDITIHGSDFRMESTGGCKYADVTAELYGLPKVSETK